MFADFHSFDDGGEIESDVCIVGAGAAGISLAVALIDTPLSVYLLESGGFHIEADVQALYEGENAGRNYYPLSACRLRFFGGSTNHWGGRSQPLSEWDFAVRPWLPHSGWPISLADLAPFYPRAQAICGLGPFVYDADLWQVVGYPPPEIDPHSLRYAFWQYSAARHVNANGTGPVVFGRDFRDVLNRAQNVRVLMHANVTRIRLDPTARMVEAFDIRSLTGKTGTVIARQFVLACGGIENARLLLISDDVEPQGVGNRNDLVGRFFMEHPYANCGMVKPASSLVVRTFNTHPLADSYVRPGVLLAPAIQARESVLGCAANFQPWEGDSAAILGDIFRELAARHWPDDLERDLARVMADLDKKRRDTFAKLWGTPAAEPDADDVILRMLIELEQAPNPDSRVTLGSGRDALGLRTARLNWQLTDLDKHSLLVCAKIIGAEFGRLKLGRVRIDDWLLDGRDVWGGGMHGSYHHLGTTRMADDPRRGVVDRDCRVHGRDNLYIAGSSVFPTAGPTNPTLTIVALALKLADQLKMVLPRG